LLRVALIQTYRAAAKTFATQISPSVMPTAQTVLASTNALARLPVVELLVLVTMNVHRDVKAVRILFAVAKIST